MLRVAALTPPGRLPTVVRDPGEWWSAVAGTSASLERPGVNAAWWRAICRPSIASALGTGRRNDLGIARRRVERGAGAAADGLDRLERLETYSSASSYVAAVGAVTAHVGALNRLDPTLAFTLGAGVRVMGLRYGSSRALFEYAAADSPLAQTIDAALDAVDASGDAALVDVSSPEDLLTALVMVRLLRDRGQTGYVALIDHGYENFTLSPYLAALRTSRAFGTIFDAVVEEKDDREVLVPRIVEALAAGRPLRGYLRLEPPEREAASRERARAEVPTIAPPTPTFAPWPILFTRVSERRCYWARCTFCVHNVKYENRSAPSVAEVPRAVRRIRVAMEAGYRQAIFSDEALSPAMLRSLSAGIGEDGLMTDHPDFRWACRSKLEHSHDRQLMKSLGRAGCAEILFGLESTSDRVLALMDKQTPRMSTGDVRRILDDMDAEGIGAHANLIVGFPGDTPDEATASVEFLADALARLRNATYTVNRFTLFAGTPIARDPERFGLELIATADDMPYEVGYRAATRETESSARAIALQPPLDDWLASRLGWDRQTDGGRGLGARELYFGSGHGLVFKSFASNPMDPIASSAA